MKYDTSKLVDWQFWEAKEIERILKEFNMGSNEVSNVDCRCMDESVCECEAVCEACAAPGTYYDDKINGGEVNVDDCVHEFNLKFKFYDRMDTEQRIGHAARMVKEESKEVVKALEEHLHSQTIESKAALIKELCDLEYVMSQAILLLDLSDYMCEAFKEVHGSNMSKVDDNGEPIFDKKGKVLKGPNYRPADMVDVVCRVDNFYAEVK